MRRRVLFGLTANLFAQSRTDADVAWLRLVIITEGRYHQVRRMFAAVGNHVEALHRDRVGGLELPADLAAGAWRVMTETDVGAIFTPR